MHKIYKNDALKFINKSHRLNRCFKAVRATFGLGEQLICAVERKGLRSKTKAVFFYCESKNYL